MSLISEHESIYSKIVCIGPKYVLVNKLNTRLQITQVGVEDQIEVLESGDRKEWYWPDTHQQQKILMRLENENGFEIAEFTDRIKKNEEPKWLWSSPIEITE